jgi:hypothetical protein
MDWPNALKAELASRRCIIFLGSGASYSCVAEDGAKHLPNWKEFLETLRISLTTSSDFSVIDELLNKEKYLDAAEVIRNSLTSADFTRIIRDTFVQPKFSESTIHQCVLEIDPKVVITTNYDQIYDFYCQNGLAKDGYNVCKYYESHLVSDLRSPIRLIIKAHGCVSDPSKIVLSRSQYFQARQNYPSFYEVLDALFLTHTLLFIGYSLSDPDIQLVLENVNIVAPSAHPHYAVIPDETPSVIELAISKAYNIHFIKYETGNYDELNKSIEELRDAIKQMRINNPA